jgi:hypothetical protein
MSRIINYSLATQACAATPELALVLQGSWRGTHALPESHTAAAYEAGGLPPETQPSDWILEAYQIVLKIMQPLHAFSIVLTFHAHHLLVNAVASCWLLPFQVGV